MRFTNSAVQRAFDALGSSSSQLGPSTRVSTLDRARSEAEPSLSPRRGRPTTSVERGSAEEGVVLVVDDDPAMRKLLDVRLTQAGFGVITASAGAEALEVIAREPVSLVLLDERMPGMSGLEVLGCIRETPKDGALPVILVTVEDELHQQVGGLDAGADDYLTKPVQMPALIARIRTHMRRATELSGSITMLKQRLDAVDLLRRIRPGDDPAAIAAAAYEVLMAQDGIEAVGMVAFQGAGTAISLGGAGAWVTGIPAGEPLPSVVARTLITYVEAGPRVERASPRQGGDLSLTGVPDISAAYDIAVAPIMGQDGPIGALSIAADPEGSSPYRNSILSSATDFAAVLGALLTPSLDGDARRGRARDELEHVISTAAFKSVFQPVVDIVSGGIVGYEALTRWDDGVRPDVRFGEAHALGLGIAAETAALRQSLLNAQSLPPDAWLSVNASPALVLSGVLEELVRDVPRELVVELTEHEKVDDYPALRAALDRCSGVKVAVDDAGAGYASMHHILDLRPELVKLDIQWVRHVDEDPPRQALISAVVGFAMAMDFQVIAEGIETAAERQTLLRIGVPLGQGYLFSNPAVATEVATGILGPGTYEATHSTDDVRLRRRLASRRPTARVGHSGGEPVHS